MKPAVGFVFSLSAAFSFEAVKVKLFEKQNIYKRRFVIKYRQNAAKYCKFLSYKTITNRLLTEACTHGIIDIK
jgi:hypothetical protein